MKKLFTFLLAGIMVLSLVACGGEETTTANNGAGTATTANSNSGGESGGTSYEWPSKVSSAKWTGKGNIICVEEVSASSMGEVEIYIDKATMDEFGAYVKMLMGNGLRGDEPSLSFSDGVCSWNGQEGAIKVTLYETEGPERGYVDGAYQLLIRIQTDAACFK